MNYVACLVELDSQNLRVYLNSTQIINMESFASIAGSYINMKIYTIPDFETSINLDSLVNKGR